MNTEPLVHTYAEALLEAAADKGVLDDVRDEAELFARLLREDRDLRLFIENPRLERSVKRQSLETALRGQVSDIFLNFVLLLLDKGRQGRLGDILEEFVVLWDRKAGILRVRATSAVPLSPETLESLKTRMAETTGKTIEVTNDVDPDILGGLVVRFDGMVADGSLRTALRRMRARLSTVKLGSDLIHED